MILVFRRVGRVATLVLVAVLAAAGLMAVPSSAAAATCPCSFFPSTTTPAGSADSDTKAVELGMKFSAETAGTVSAIRFYKQTGNSGTHIGHLWTSTGTLLASATFTSETATGWQQVNLANPVTLTANTTYVVSYRAPVGRYSATANYFTQARTNSPIKTPVNAGVYRYGNSLFPSTVYKSSNYWVDVVFNSATPADTTAPTVTSVTPASQASNVGTAINVTASFSETLATSTVTTTNFTVTSSAGAVAGTVAYDNASRTASFTPSADLANSTVYTATLRGGSTGIKDAAGNALVTNYTWSFTTAAPTSPPLPSQTEPIVLVTSAANPFTSYYAEILRGEGLNEFSTLAIEDVTANGLAAHRSVLLGEMPLTDNQVTLLTSYVNNGGQLIAMRPDKKLANLLGLTDASNGLSDQYLKLSGASPITSGITQDTMQFHGTADNYSLNGANALASLYANVSTATTFPAISLRAVGANGGQAAAFTYDLAKSVVYTRQGNPGWSGQNRDGDLLTRSDDLFFGNAANDPQPDWVNLDKAQIPQADEQQHVLSNLLTSMTASKQPLPKFWFLPNGKKAAVIETGDDHGNNGTTGRFNQYDAMSPVNCNVNNWECVRGTSYIYPNTAMTQADAQNFNAKGFEIAVHVSSNCGEWTPQSLQNNFTNDLAQFAANFPTLPPVQTNRLHCIVWSDFNSQAKVEAANGIRFDTNYYFYPAQWVQNRPGLFTGSGQVLKFANPDGSLIDVYQAATQLTDESNQSYPHTTEVLLDNAIGSKGYYAILTTNHHTDLSVMSESTSTVLAAQQRGIPVVSAKQMLTWLDGRNASKFSNHTWANNALSFDVSVGSGAEGLIRSMVPVRTDTGVLTGLQSSGAAVPYTVETIKGIDYAFFAATNATYTATYAPDTVAPVVVSAVPESNATEVNPNTPISATFNESLTATSVTSATVSVAANGVNVAGTAGYDSATKTVTFTPTNQLALNTTFTLTVRGGVNGVKDVSGNALVADFTRSFTTAAVVKSTIFSDSVVPTTPSYPDSSAYTLGVKFQSTSDGFISSVRYYKGVNNTGTHVGGLWNASGQLLASGQFVNETASGWQTVVFNTPVAVTANTTYTAGYVAPNGGYAADAGGLSVQQGSGAIRSLVGGGVYVTGGTLNLPTNSAPSNTNYYVDAVFQTTAGLPPTTTTTTTTVPPTTTTTVSPVTTTTTSTTTSTSTTTTSTVPPGGPKTLFGSSVPAITSASDNAAVELGVRFTSDVNGQVTGVRFYKGAGNTGTHVGSLWSSTGTRLATGTFVDETATGWQTLIFPSPVSITAGSTYVASYHAPNGGYAYNGAFFNTTFDAGSLHAFAGNNGVYQYGGASAFPTSSYNNTNYWVDPIVQ